MQPQLYPSAELRKPSPALQYASVSVTAIQALPWVKPRFDPPAMLPHVGARILARLVNYFFVSQLKLNNLFYLIL